MKFITILFSYFMGKFNGGKSDNGFLTVALVEKIRKMVLLLGLVTVAAIGLSLSLIKAIQDAGEWFQKNYVMNFSPGFFAALIGAAGFLALMRYATSQDRWLERNEKVEETKKSSSPIEEAVVLLITDFVKEREFSRELREKKQAAEAETANVAHAAYMRTQTESQHTVN